MVITIESDVALNNLVIKPMITDDLSATYSGFVSYDNSLARGSHNHVKADITDFAHTHTKANITDFAHTHTKSEITDFAHNHDDRYYTESEIDTKISTLNSNISNKVTNGGGVSIVIALTQSEYDAISTKDDNTIYFVKQ